MKKTIVAVLLFTLLAPVAGKSRALSQRPGQEAAAPVSPAIARERTAWISEVLRGIQTIKPGMKRSDLSKVLTTEGGISSRTWRRYVYRECPYIKVDVTFKSARPDDHGWQEEPGDIIESISQPFLEWSIID